MPNMGGLSVGGCDSSGNPICDIFLSHTQASLHSPESFFRSFDTPF